MLTKSLEPRIAHARPPSMAPAPAEEISFRDGSDARSTLPDGPPPAPLTVEPVFPQAPEQDAPSAPQEWAALTKVEAQPPAQSLDTPAPSPAVSEAAHDVVAPQPAAEPEPHTKLEPGAVERQASEILARVGFGQSAPYVVNPAEKKDHERQEKEQHKERELQNDPVPVIEAKKGNWIRFFKVASVVLVMVLLAALAAAAVLALVGHGFLNKSANRMGTLRFALPAPEQASYLSSPAISPDGKLLAFSAVSPEKKRLLWIRPLNSLKATPLENTDDALAPFWSPDGKFIGFFAGKKLKKIAVEGGQPVVLCETDGLAGGGAWSEAGVIVFGRSFYDSLYRVPAGGGNAERLTRLDTSRGERAHLWPLFLPTASISCSMR